MMEGTSLLPIFKILVPPAETRFLESGTVSAALHNSSDLNRSQVTFKNLTT